MAAAPHHKSIAVDHWCMDLFLLHLAGIPHVLVGVGDVSHPEGTQDIWVWGHAEQGKGGVDRV